MIALIAVPQGWFVALYRDARQSKGGMALNHCYHNRRRGISGNEFALFQEESYYRQSRVLRANRGKLCSLCGHARDSRSRK